MMKRKDEDMDEEVSPWADVRKSSVLQESRLFQASQLNASKCTLVLTKLLYLINTGETLTNEEAVDMFFAVTKLFQSPDVHLRRMVYLIIKELNVESDSSLIVVSCLSKDMTSKIDLFKANSIRVLAKIMDASMVGQMERFLKQALVDKNPFIMASTLCAGQHLFQTAPDVIKRWLAEIQEALNNKARMVQYHALALLYRVKQHDKLAISKVATALARNGQINGSPMAQCLHIRIVFTLLQSTPIGQPLHPELLKYLLDCLHHKHYMVMYEAARAIVRLDSITAVQCVPAISVLQELLLSQVPVQRYASVRTLSEVVSRFPQIVAPVVGDLEQLLSDPNRTIATLAITTLLKTGVESNVDRLMKSIGGFMTDISDEFKIVLVEAIKTLAFKFPHKYPTLLNFLAQALREEGTFKFKKALVEAMLSIMHKIPEATEIGLDQFCEFIEDCEFPELSVRILHVLGEKGPSSPSPAKYIRFIFNRVILETSSVRCAAVSSLAKFGANVPTLTNHIIILLKRCLMDNDDEVRDRAIFYSNVLTAQPANLMTALNIDGSGGVEPKQPKPKDLEFSIDAYLASGDFSVPFQVSKHLQQAPIDEAELLALEQRAKLDAENGLNLMNADSCEKDAALKAAQQAAAAQAQQSPAGAAAASSKSAAGGAGGGIPNQYLELFHSIPELRELGPIFKSCMAVELTETETEYVVSCIKHILPNHVVFQFQIVNTLEEHQLENVRVEMELEDGEGEGEGEGWVEELSIPEPICKSGSTPGQAFVVFRRPADKFSSGNISCTLHFTVKEVEDGEVESGEGAEDEYQLEDIEVVEHDFMKPGEDIGLVHFRSQWEGLTESNEIVKKYSLGLDSLQAAVNAVIELLGMQPCENSGIVPEGARSHAVNLTGIFYGDVPVLARAGFMTDTKHGVTLKIAVRSQKPQINAMLTNAIR